MTDRAVRKLRKELNSGTIALILLQMIDTAAEAMYGYEIARSFDQGGDDVRLGALYPVLRSLESQGLLRSELRPSDAGPPRKYYSTTSRGTEVLAEWRRVWEETRDRVDRHLEGNDE